MFLLYSQAGLSQSTELSHKDRLCLAWEDVEGLALC